MGEGVVSTPCRTGESGAEGVPLPDAEVVAAAWESTGVMSDIRSLELGVPLRGVLGVPRVSSISWIFSLCPLTLPFLRLMRGIFAPLLRDRSISRVTLELLGKGADRTGLIGTPFQILECCPHRFVKVVLILSLDCGLEHIAHVETVFRQLQRIIVINHLVLVRSSMRVYGWAQNGALTRTKARVVRTVLKTCFAGEASAASPSKILILSFRSDAIAMRVRVAIFTGSRCTSRAGVVEFDGYKWLGGRGREGSMQHTRQIHAFVWKHRRSVTDSSKRAIPAANVLATMSR